MLAGSIPLCLCTPNWLAGKLLQGSVQPDIPPSSYMLWALRPTFSSNWQCCYHGNGGRCDVLLFPVLLRGSQRDFSSLLVRENETRCSLFPWLGSGVGWGGDVWGEMGWMLISFELNCAVVSMKDSLFLHWDAVFHLKPDCPCILRNHKNKTPQGVEKKNAVANSQGTDLYSQI